MTSRSLFPIERHSFFWLLRLLIHQSHQAKLPILSRMECGKRRWSKFKVSTAGRLYHSNVKFAESSTQLSCLSNVTTSLSLFQNECPLKMLAVVASDLPKLSNKIAYPERNRMEKKLMVTV